MNEFLLMLSKKFVNQLMYFRSGRLNQDLPQLFFSETQFVYVTDSVFLSKVLN